MPPTVAPAHASASAHVSTAPDEGPVLVIEDESLLAFDLCQSLEEAGLRVLGPCLTYRDALAAIAQESPRYAVMDLDLGRGDLKPGFEGERILAILTNAGCRCVIHSGRTELFKTLACYFPRATLVAKPVPTKRVVEALLGSH